MSNFNIYLKQIMQERKITNKALAEWITDNYKKISKETIAKYRDGSRTPAPDLISIIAKYFKVDEQFFFNGEYENKIQIKTIPLIGLASCGIPREYALDGYEPVPVSIDIYRDGMYAVKAEGNSMSPKINHNNLVYCLPNETIDNGHIVHYTLNGESGIKKYKLNEKGDIISLVPINPDYDVITIHADEPHSLKMARVLGVVDTEF